MGVLRLHSLGAVGAVAAESGLSCASAKKDSVLDIDRLLFQNADPNAIDCNGQSALMISALNYRHGEDKCRLLVDHCADVYVRLPGGQTVLEWARERLSP